MGAPEQSYWSAETESAITGATFGVLQPCCSFRFACN